ncbi:MAG: hypothetical protein D6776_10550 [Planctomycetota bacterium]|nr:MAG: hypothetical protein D6776_10550 [Planctomycetota bacterium]
MTGTIDTNGNTIFGASGTAVPVNVGFTVDTSLAGPTVTILKGSNILGTTFATDFYGYDVAGLSHFNLSFGNHSWASSSLRSLSVAPGKAAHLWLDVDLATGATPTGIWLSARDAAGQFDVGGGRNTPAGMTFRDVLTVTGGGNQGSGFIATIAPSATFAATAVPEPHGLSLAASLLAILLAQRRRNRP